MGYMSLTRLLSKKQSPCLYLMRSYKFLKHQPVHSVSKEMLRCCFLNNRRSLCSKEPLERVSITFLKPDGTKITRTGNTGETIRDLVALEDTEIPGYGSCDGTLSCSTCHLILSPEDYDKLEIKPNDEESDLIAYAPENCDTSRLGCNVFLTKSMDGMVVRLPNRVEDRRQSELREDEG